MKKEMKKEMIKRVISIILVLLVFCGMIAFAEINIDAINYEYVKADEAERSFAEYEETVLREEKRRTDRFIIKYKDMPNSEAVMKTAEKVYMQLKEEEQYGKLAIEPQELRDISEECTDNFDLSEKMENKDRGVLSRVESIYEFNNSFQEYEVIKLDESINADEFVDKFTKETNEEIEYIQPDYKLEVSDIDLNYNMEEINAEAEIDEESNIIVDVAEENADDTIPEAQNNTVINEGTSDMDLYSNIDTLNILQDDIYSAWQITKGTGVKIAVIDGKVDVTHPDLNPHIINAFDITTNSELTYDDSLMEQYYHGTHVTGIIASTVPESEIIPIAVFEDGKAYTSDIIKAIDYAKTQGADIVNCSWGGRNYSPALEETMKNSGMLFVCAAGNNRLNVDETPIYPACFGIDNVICVASLNQDLGFSYYSNYGNSVDVAMYGRNISSTIPNGEYGEQSGTSMAAAYVTAGAAMARSINNDAEIKEVLLNTSVSLSDLQDKVNCGKKLSFNNLVRNITNNDLIEILPEDDFDVIRYEESVPEDIELFNSLETVHIEAGGNNTAFIKNDGTLWMAGDNSYGQLGNGTCTSSNVPVQVIGLKNIVQVAVGETHCIALDENGIAYLWGNNIYGSVSYSADTVITIPVIHSISGVEYVEAGTNTSFVIKGENGIYAQGNNSYGQLGNGSKSEAVYSPVLMKNSYDANMVKSYGKHTFFICNGALYGCGADVHNIFREPCGTITTPKVLLEDIKYIDTGINHAVAIDDFGNVLTWGANEWGQCGAGEEMLEDCTAELNLQNVVNVKCGKEHTVVLLEDGTIITWGYNVYGQIGDGTKDKRYVPYVVNGVDGVEEISAGLNHIIALSSDKRIYCWGDNRYGQYGNGSKSTSRVPVSFDPKYNYTKYAEKSVDVESEKEYVFAIDVRNSPSEINTEVAFNYDPNFLEVVSINDGPVAEIICDKGVLITQENSNIIFNLTSNHTSTYSSTIVLIKMKATSDGRTTVSLTGR